MKTKELLKNKDIKIEESDKEIRKLQEINTKVDTADSQCKDCHKHFTELSDLKEHKITEHHPFVLRLKRIARQFNEEKMKHKEICKFSYNCRHPGICYTDFY